MAFTSRKSRDQRTGKEKKVWLKSLLFLFVMLLMVLEGRHVLAEIQFDEVVTLLKHTPDFMLVLYMAGGFAAVSATTLYDLAWFHFNPRHIRKSAIFRTAWTASAINNLAGMGGMGGAMVRTLFYRQDHLDNEDLLRINVLLLPSYYTGLGMMMWLAMLGKGAEGRILSGSPAADGVRILFRAYVLLFLLSGFIPIPYVKTKLEKWGFTGSLRIKMSMVAVSTLSWTTAAMFLWVIGHQINPGLSLVGSLLTFTIAMSVGMVSPMPAGLGVFDVVMVLGLQDSGLRATEALGAVMMFRIFYYLVPFVTASTFMLWGLVSREIQRIRPVVQQAWKAAQQKGIMLLWLLLEQLDAMTGILKWLAITIVSTLAVLSAATPYLPQRMHFLEPLLRMLQKLSLSPQRVISPRK